jgi:hypothetical protein
LLGKFYLKGNRFFDGFGGCSGIRSKVDPRVRDGTRAILIEVRRFGSHLHHLQLATRDKGM